MTYYEQQEMEFATEKPRTFKLKLSDADVVRIFEKAGSVGLTASELLESFIGDLSAEHIHTVRTRECTPMNGSIAAVFMNMTEAHF